MSGFCGLDAQLERTKPALRLLFLALVAALPALLLLAAAYFFT
jgi:hypothetical protein